MDLIMNKKKTIRQARFKIKEIKKLNFFENNSSQCELPNRILRRSDFKNTVQIKIDDKSNSIIFVFNTVCHHKGIKNEYELFGISILFDFKIHSMTSMYKRKDEDKYDFPDQLMVALINIVVGTTRGILHESITDPNYKNLILPPMNTMGILKGLQVKNNHKEKNES